MRLQHVKYENRKELNVLEDAGPPPGSASLSDHLFLIA